MQSILPTCTSLQDTAVDNGGAGLVLDLAVITAGGLEGLDDSHGLLVGNLAEDDVAAVQPGGDDGGDEELGAVAVDEALEQCANNACRVP